MHKKLIPFSTNKLSLLLSDSTGDYSPGCSGQNAEKPRGLTLVLNGDGSILVVVTVTAADDRRFTEKLILRALIISLVIHLLAFFTYKIGLSQGWWANWQMPRWMQVVSRALIPPIPKKEAIITPQPVPLMFVETDPANAIPEPPKAAKFEGAHNTIAANPQIVKPSDVPNIRGRQTKVLKTTEDARPKAQPIQPTPPPRPQTTVRVAHAQKTYTPGDMAMASPTEKAQESKQSDSETVKNVEPQPQPVHHRPRTLAEAMQREGTLGQQAFQNGGVGHVALTSSLDVKSSALGDYEGVMVDAIRTQWYKLLENVPWNASGKVVVNFKLYPNGRVDQVVLAHNEVTDELANFCESAIIDPSPFGPWPTQMRLDIPKDYLDLQFTFYYDVE